MYKKEEYCNKENVRFYSLQLFMSKNIFLLSQIRSNLTIVVLSLLLLVFIIKLFLSFSKLDCFVCQMLRLDEHRGGPFEDWHYLGN